MGIKESKRYGDCARFQKLVDSDLFLNVKKVI